MHSDSTIAPDCAWRPGADSAPQQDERSGVQTRAIVRHRGKSLKAGTDFVSEEFPVALVFNDISHAVMMTTPRDLEEFAVGFALTEGVVDRVSDIFDVEVHMHANDAEVHLTIGQGAFLALKQKRRALTGRTGCGVCGIESLQMLDLVPEHITQRLPGIALDAAVERAARELPAHQVLMKQTGGVHAAAWCDFDGAVLKVFEDVGRHNGLDKLIGHLARERVDMTRGFVFISSRASYELARKAARMGIPMLATISAPTSLAIDIAEQAGMKLVSFCRNDGFVEYTGDGVDAGNL